MSQIAVVCVDGSEHSHRAVEAGLAVLRDEFEPVVVTVADLEDPMLVTGTGFAGGSMSPEEYDRMERERVADADQNLLEAATDIGVPDARRVLLRGSPGAAICEFAEKEDAAVILIGSRGRGGFKRAVLGSVSDHVVRSAFCPVVVTSSAADATPDG